MKKRRNPSEKGQAIAKLIMEQYQPKTQEDMQIALKDVFVFSVKQISPFSSSEFPIVIVGKSPLSAGLVRKHVPLLHPAA